MPTLRTLTIRDALVGDEFVAGLPQLNQQIGYLELTHTRITDHALSNLSRFTNLRELVLTGTSISDEGVTRLATLKNLKQLQLEDTRVTAEGIEKLKQALPGCSVSW